MGVSGRSYASAGAVLAVAGGVAIAPIAPVAPQLPGSPIAAAAVHLTAGDSILNVPLNLLIDLISVPANEISALQMFADSGFFTGSWFIPSATNLWGTDPGDIGHYYSLANILMPFPVLANGIAEQFAGYAQATLPVSEWCAAESCLPTLPTVPITGITPVDQGIWAVLTATGLAPFPLTENWRQISPLELMTTGYTFSAPGADLKGGYPGYYDPSGPAYANPAWSAQDSDGSYLPPFQPTTPVYVDPTTGARTPYTPGSEPPPGTELMYKMPWDDTHFTLDPTEPFTDFFKSLMQDPADNLAQLGSPLGIIQGFQSLAAAMVIDFDPLTPGSPLCPLGCNLPEPLTIPSIVKFIGALFPGNPQIDAWLKDWNDGTANWATPAQIEGQQNLLNQGLFDKDNGFTWPSPFNTGDMPDTPPGPFTSPVGSGPSLAAGEPDKPLGDLAQLIQLLESGDLSGFFGTASADLSALW